MKARILTINNNTNQILNIRKFDTEELAQDAYDSQTRGMSELADDLPYRVDLEVTHPENGELIRRSLYTRQYIVS